MQPKVVWRVHAHGLGTATARVGIGLAKLARAEHARGPMLLAVPRAVHWARHGARVCQRREEQPRTHKQESERVVEPLERREDVDAAREPSSQCGPLRGAKPP